MSSCTVGSNSSFFFLFGIFHHMPSPSPNLLLLWRSTNLLLQIRFFSRSSFSSSFDLDLLFLFFSSFSPSPSSNLLLWNSSLPNLSSTWLNCSLPTVELEFESLDSCRRTRAFQTRDDNLQHCFKIVLTYYILSHSCASLQITSTLSPLMVCPKNTLPTHG